MASSYKDSNPNAGSKGSGGMKNNDGREMGAAYNNAEKAKMNAKETYNPNEDAPKLGQVGGVAE